MKKVLLMGGPLDGEVVKVKRYTPEIERLVIPLTPKVRANPTETAEKEALERVRYIRTREWKNNKLIYAPPSHVKSSIKIETS